MSASNVSQSATVPVMRARAIETTSSPPRSSAWTGPVVGATVLVLGCGWLFWNFLISQFHTAIEQQADWGHTLVIPFIAAYFVYLQRNRLLTAPFKTTWAGLVVMVVGVGLYMVCTAGPLTLRHHNIQGACVALSITGIVLLFCGVRAMRWLWFPLAYMFVFGQYISESLIQRVTFWMQDVTARGAGVALSMFLDVDRMGNTLFVHHNGASVPLNIATACSGMRMLMAFLALGTAMAFTGLKYPWQRVLLVVMGVPTALFVNILRVCTLGVLTIYDAGLAAGDFHSFIGLLWLLPAFLLYLGMMWLISHLVIEERGKRSSMREQKDLNARPIAHVSPFDRQSKFALLTTCVTLVVCSIGFRYAVAALNIYLQKEPVELRETLVTLPRSVGQWVAPGEDEHFDETMLEALGTRDTLSRTYVLGGDERNARLLVHIAYYTGMIDAVPHIPDRCFVAGGLEPQTLSEAFPLHVDQSAWLIDDGPVNLATGQHYRRVNHRDAFTNQLEPVRMPVGDLKLRVTEFARKDQPGVKYFGGFFFVANGRATATPEDIRLLAFKPSERFAYYCKVQFIYANAGSLATREHCLDLVSDFLTAFLPELMLRLPDWQDLERRDPRAQPLAAGPNAPGYSGPAPAPSGNPASAH